MQRVTDRTDYDTDNATAIATYDRNTTEGEYFYLVETLYKRDDGTYFLHGQGGALTAYATETDTGRRTGGDTIDPLTEADALDWCERRSIDSEIVMDEFEPGLEE